MSNGSTRMKGYRPEVRTSYHAPSMHCGQIVDSQWRPIEYVNRFDQTGIPAGYFDKKLNEHGLLSFSVAQAIRWWFISGADAERAIGSICLETRLQSYDLVIEYKVTVAEAVGALNCRGKEIVEEV